MDQELINRIRENTDIVEFIGKYIALVKKGKNYFGLCPFHNDSNPSLSVSKDKQIFKCFVCGETGNVFNFVMKYENVSFAEAVKIVGNDIGISISSNNNVNHNNYDKYYELLNTASLFFQNNLMSNLGLKAREYLESRQLTLDLIKEFEIGLSLDKRDDLTKMMLKKGYTLEILNSLGLSTNDYDTYINRIIFPLCNPNGKVNGFSGRIYNGENTNKYLNTTDTLIFKKGENIFNYHRAKDDVRKKKYVIIMEGFMAVIRSHSIGVKNCIATMGTSLTNDQISLIRKLSNNVYLCFDGDSAGIKATINNGELFLKSGFNVKVIPLTNNLDPDDYIIQNGSDKFLSLIENALNFIDFKIRNLKSGVDFNSVDSKTEYINLVLLEIKKEKDLIKREIILKNLANETNVWYNTLEKKLNELLTNQDDTKINNSNLVFLANKKKKNKYQKAMQTVIYYMLLSPEVITTVNNQQVYFPDINYRILANEISYYYDRYGSINIADFSSYIETKDELKEVYYDISCLELDDNIDLQIVLENILVIKNYNIALEIKRLENLIINEIDPIEQSKISNQIMKLKIGSENNNGK